MLTENEKRALLYLAEKKERHIGKQYTPGYGGIHRPERHEIPPPYQTLLDQKLCRLTEAAVPRSAMAMPCRAVWAFVLTPQGEVMARMLD